MGLARGARDRLGADWGIGVTGVAGPEPQDGQPVGTVFIAIVGPATAAGTAASDRFEQGSGPEQLTELNLQGSRNRIRSETVERVVELFLAVLTDADGTR
jgi:nicotinamide-nucleotide amidase